MSDFPGSRQSILKQPPTEKIELGCLLKWIAHAHKYPHSLGNRTVSNKKELLVKKILREALLIF